MDCTAQPMDPYITTNSVQVDATICESGDIFVRIITSSHENFFDWVSLEKISNPNKVNSQIASLSLFKKAVA